MRIVNLDPVASRYTFCVSSSIRSTGQAWDDPPRNAANLLRSTSPSSVSIITSSSFGVYPDDDLSQRRDVILRFKGTGRTIYEMPWIMLSMAFGYQQDIAEVKSGWVEYTVTPVADDWDPDAVTWNNAPAGEASLAKTLRCNYGDSFSTWSPQILIAPPDTVDGADPTALFYGYRFSAAHQLTDITLSPSGMDLYAIFERQEIEDQYQ